MVLVLVVAGGLAIGLATLAGAWALPCAAPADVAAPSLIPRKRAYAA
jgi:hypothetical protein